MAQTFTFETLDDATRDYLLAVRDRQGKGMPGVFFPNSHSLPLVGCILGPIIVLGILIYTLSPNQIYNNPDGLALFQTGGIMLGVWMVLAALRSWLSRGSRRVAGHWTYADPVFLYEAKAEQVKVTPLADLVEVTAIHNINNGAYQHTVATLVFEDKRTYKLTLHDQRRAEAFVQFGNYLAWARSPEGGERANLPPVVLGGLAKYVAKNESEPLEPDGNLNLNEVRLDVESVPEEPQRARFASPNVLIYVFLLVAGVGCYFFMRFVDIPARDEAIYQLVTRDPIQPVFLRQYLMDDRNTLHRDDVYKKLEPFYEGPISQVRLTVHDVKLKAGMVRLLESLQKADLPVVSIRVAETKTPPGDDSNRDTRVTALREIVVRLITDSFTQAWESKHPLDPTRFDTPPPKMGEQLMAFTEAPEGTNAHLDIAYQFIPVAGSPGKFSMKADITLRDDVDGEQTWKGELFTTRPTTAPQTAAEISRWSQDFGEELTTALIGKKAIAMPQIQFPVDFGR